MMTELKKISLMRKIRNMTQKELAEKSGISQSLVARIEAGSVDPAYSKVEKIFSVLQKEQHDNDVLAGQIMSKKISSISPLRSLAAAMKVMKNKNISQMPVVDKGVIVGTVTEKDVAHVFVMNENPSLLKVKDIMENPLPSIDIHTSLTIISSLLDAQPAVLVTKNGRTSGIITRADLLKVIKRTI